MADFILPENSENASSSSPEASAASKDLTLSKQLFNTGKRVWFKSKTTGELRSYDVGWMRYQRMRRAVKNWAQFAQEVDGQLIMIGLTYRPGDRYHPGDKNEFFQKLRRGLGVKLLGYAWVAELQTRGSIHYHAIIAVRKGTYVPKPDQAGWWIHGNSHIEYRVRSPFYLLTYLGKEYQKEFSKFPRGIRCFSVEFTDEGDRRRRLRIIRLPSWAIAKVLEKGLNSLPEIKAEHKGLTDWVYIGATSEETQEAHFLDWQLK